MIDEIADVVGRLMSDAEHDGFSGVVRVEVAGEVLHESAHGFADRAHGIANQTTTRLAAASGLKPCTAIVVMHLVEDGALSLDTSVRDVLGEESPTTAANQTSRARSTEPRSRSARSTLPRRS